jgi:hypothetical protein
VICLINRHEKFADKGVIRNRKPKDDRQYSAKEKGQKDKHLSIKQYTEN